MINIISSFNNLTTYNNLRMSTGSLYRVHQNTKNSSLKLNTIISRPSKRSQYASCAGDLLHSIRRGDIKNMLIILSLRCILKMKKLSLLWLENMESFRINQMRTEIFWSLFLLILAKLLNPLISTPLHVQQLLLKTKQLPIKEVLVIKQSRRSAKSLKNSKNKNNRSSV